MRFLFGLSVALGGVGASLASDSDSNSKSDTASVEPTQSQSKSKSGSNSMWGQSRVNLYLPENWKPEGVQASIVNVEPTATTFSLDCAKSASDCVLPVSTVTQGPSMWACEGSWRSVGDMDAYALINSCDLGDKQQMVCTQAVTRVKDGKTSSSVMTMSTSWQSDLVYPVPITAGAKKLAPSGPTATKTAAPESSSTAESSTISVVHSTFARVGKPVVNYPKPSTQSQSSTESSAESTITKAPVSQTEAEEAATSTEPPPEESTAGAVPGVARNPILAGAMVAIGGAAIML